MAKRQDISAEYARQLLDYNPETGVLTWKVRTPDMFEDGARSKEWRCRNWNSKCAGRVAGCHNKTDGYIYVRIADGLYRAHRLIWLICKGEWPADEVDHEFGDRTDNRISRLREATRTENSQNLPKKNCNTSGYVGVSLHSQTGRWVARIRSNGKYLSLGCYGTPQEASLAYLSAKAKHHPFQPFQRQ